MTNEQFVAMVARLTPPSTMLALLQVKQGVNPSNVVFFPSCAPAVEVNTVEDIAADACATLDALIRVARDTLEGGAP